MTTTIHRTRFPELSYRQDAPHVWRIVDSLTENSIGPQYRSRAELLADLERYAAEFGCEGVLASERRKIIRTHRDVFPHSDHGYTVIESIRFETHDGSPLSPTIPAGGHCERLSNLPGGSPFCDVQSEAAHYGIDPGSAMRVNSETIHPGFWKIGTGAIVRIDREPDSTSDDRSAVQ